MEKGVRTIVGGRSAAIQDPASHPRCIEILLKKAKVDATFRRRFLSDPVGAAQSIGLELNDSEKKILCSTPGEVIEKMVENTFVPKHHVSTFMGAKTAAMLSLILATSVLMPGHTTTGIEAAPEPSLEEMETKEQLVQKKLAIIQEALQHYKEDTGAYPSTLEWVTGVPLEEYLDPANLYDPWYRKFHYRGVKDEDGIITKYWLECLGQDVESPLDNIDSPLEPASHKFAGGNPLRIVFPQNDTWIDPPSTDDAPILLMAEHLSADASLDWYLDSRKIGSTVDEHVLPLPAGTTGGGHWLVVIDEEDNYRSVSFRVERK